MKNVKKKNIFKMFGAWLKERIRKILVALKKNPQAVPIAALCSAFLVYSLNLTHISNTTAKINSSNMGLASFVTMLFMILSFVCMLGAFPKRKKPKISMIIIMMVLYSATIVADVIYLDKIFLSFEPDYWATLSVIDQTHIITSHDTIFVHIILTAVTMVLVLIEPLIAKLLKLIKTSIEVEGSGDIAAIDIASED